MPSFDRTSRSLLAPVAIAAALASLTVAGTALAFGGTSRPTRPAGQATAADFFEREVRPILASRCESCHGERVQMSGLRLDSRAALIHGGKRGTSAVPGNADESLLVKAVLYNGALKMPPAGKLSDKEIATLRAWVRDGALWPEAAKGADPAAQLWSLQPVRRPKVPVVHTKGWARNPIDAFVLAKLEKEGLKPSPYADRRTLIRRVTLDLTGLPPTPAEVDAFLADQAPGAWERVVDRLLASPHYGERMAQHWLDLARYADSDGYHDDTDRSMWAFRDYVIRSYNENKPFDRFTIEQLAGDLLPNPTLEQKIASGFNRCGPTSSEGGAIPEEYLAKYAVDRVDTTGNVWLGLTVQCCECHNHKFDPISTKEFYQLFAFFDQVPEEALYRGADAPPYINTPTPEQQRKLDELKGQVAALQLTAKSCGPGTPQAADAAKKLDEAKKQLAAFDKSLPKLRVMQDVSPRRQTYVLVRGDYRNHGEPVQPAVPAVLGSLPAGMKANRLALATWLMDPHNPLPSRVTVNRLWELLFDAGLERTSEDFGMRGEKPTHPELLDWLASEFMSPTAGNETTAHNWDVKHILRMIVTSATYQQSSRATPALLARDPQNRLLARGARFRLQAEFIRDNALAISGLLDRNRPVGGPSAKPYQPGDLWRELSSGDQEAKSYRQDHGADLYRRGLYTFWKRSILYPAFAVFDAPNREVCVVHRPIKNTPLQAFTTLNDVTYMEAARVFAQRLLTDGGSTPEARLTYAMRLALARPPSAKEQKALLGVYQDSLVQFRRDPAAAVKLASVGEAPRPKELDPAEHAAWTCVCNAILNLDETLTKE